MMHMAGIDEDAEGAEMDLLEGEYGSLTINLAAMPSSVVVSSVSDSIEPSSTCTWVTNGS